MHAAGTEWSSDDSASGSAAPPRKRTRRAAAHTLCTTLADAASPVTFVATVYGTEHVVCAHGGDGHEMLLRGTWPATTALVLWHGGVTQPVATAVLAAMGVAFPELAWGGLRRSARVEEEGTASSVAELARQKRYVVHVAWEATNGARGGDTTRARRPPAQLVYQKCLWVACACAPVQPPPPGATVCAVLPSGTCVRGDVARVLSTAAAREAVAKRVAACCQQRAVTQAVRDNADIVAMVYACEVSNTLETLHAPPVRELRFVEWVVGKAAVAAAAARAAAEFAHTHTSAVVGACTLRMHAVDTCASLIRGCDPYGATMLAADGRVRPPADRELAPERALGAVNASVRAARAVLEMLLAAQRTPLHTADHLLCEEVAAAAVRVGTHPKAPLSMVRAAAWVARVVAGCVAAGWGSSTTVAVPDERGRVAGGVAMLVVWTDLLVEVHGLLLLDEAGGGPPLDACTAETQWCCRTTMRLLDTRAAQRPASADAACLLVGCFPCCLATCAFAARRAAKLFVASCAFPGPMPEGSPLFVLLEAAGGRVPAPPPVARPLEDHGWPSVADQVPLVCTRVHDPPAGVPPATGADQPGVAAVHAALHRVMSAPVLVVDPRVATVGRRSVCDLHPHTPLCVSAATELLAPLHGACVRARVTCRFVWGGSVADAASARVLLASLRPGVGPTALACVCGSAEAAEAVVAVWKAVAKDQTEACAHLRGTWVVVLCFVVRGVP